MSNSKFDKICLICEKSYKYCSGCSDYAKYPRWMESFCSDNCRKIFNIVMEYKAGVKTVYQAAEALNACDLSDRGHFEKGIKEIVDIILSNGSKVENKPIIEDKPISEKSADDKPLFEDIKNDEKKPDEMKQKFDSKNKFNGYKKVNSNNYKK